MGLKDIAGQRFGSLVAIRPCGITSQRVVVWRCICDCGKERRCPGTSLRIGKIDSCGCKAKARKAERLRAMPASMKFRKHNHTCRIEGDAHQTKTYQSWMAMRRRCLAPGSTGYSYYGGLGISVCQRWQGEHGFENFLEDMGERPSMLTIDRINPYGNYEPNNCRWVSRADQITNRRPRLCKEDLHLLSLYSYQC